MLLEDLEHWNLAAGYCHPVTHSRFRVRYLRGALVPVQELHEADLAASVAQEQLVHERQRTGRLKQAIKSAFEDARTPAAGLTGASRCLLTDMPPCAGVEPMS